MDGLLMVLIVVVSALVGALLGGELLHRRDRAAMQQAATKLDAARRDVVAARDVLATVRGR